MKFRRIPKSHLKKFNFIQSKDLFNNNSIRIGASGVLGFLFSESKNILQTVESDLDNFAVHHRKQITQRGNTTLLD